MKRYETRLLHNQILKAYIDKNGDIDAAALQLNLPKDKIEKVLSIYSNYYDALFTKIGLSKEEVANKIKDIIREGKRFVYNKDLKDFEAVDDGNLQLKAVELYLKITGGLQPAPINITVHNDNRNITFEQHTYNEIKKNPELMEGLLKIVEKQAVKAGGTA